MSPAESPAVDALSAVRAAGVAAIDGVLPGGRRERGEPRLDAADRRAVSSDAVLRQPADVGLVGSQSQARATVDAADGDRGDLPASADDLARGRAQDLPVSAAERGDRAARSGVEHGHHVHPVATRLLVPDGDHGLVQSTRAGMAVVEHAHGRLLHRGAGGGAAACDAGDLQQRSGLPVHGRGVHQAIGAPRDRNQHGWPRARLGQRVHRTTGAKRQVRGSLLARLRRRLGGRRATGGVLPVLCDRAPAPSPRLPDPRRGVRPAELKPQEALGR